LKPLPFLKKGEKTSTLDNNYLNREVINEF